MSSPSGRWGTPGALQNMQPGPQGQPWWYNSPGVQASPYNRSILDYGKELDQMGPPGAGGSPPPQVTGGDRFGTGQTPGGLSQLSYPNVPPAAGFPEVRYDAYGIPYGPGPVPFSDGGAGQLGPPALDLDYWQYLQRQRNPAYMQYGNAGASA